MDPMMELANALNALTAALQKFSSQTTNAYGKQCNASK